MTDQVTYTDVNAAWPYPLPPVTAKHARVFYKRLVLKFGGRKLLLPSYAFRENRSWAAPNGTKDALGTGWPRMVHDASHWVFENLHPTLKTHSSVHAALELAMIRHCLAQGWTKPKPVKAKPSTGDRRAADLARTQAGIKRWETKAKRAATALRKLRQKERRLIRAAAKPGNAEKKKPLNEGALGHI